MRTDQVGQSLARKVTVCQLISQFLSSFGPLKVHHQFNDYLLGATTLGKRRDADIFEHV